MDSTSAMDVCDSPSPQVNGYSSDRMFEYLPLELQTAIIESLALVTPEIGETRPVSYNQMVTEEPWFDFTRNRKTLRSLCAVSKSMRDIAGPVLYKTLVIWDEEGLLLLLRTLLEHPEYGKYARYVSCHLTLTDEQVFRKVIHLCTTMLDSINPGLLWKHHTPAMRQLAVVFRISTERKLAYGQQEELPQMMMAAILSLTPNIDTLMLQIPLAEAQLDYDALIDAFTPDVPLRDGESLPEHPAPRTGIFFSATLTDRSMEDRWPVGSSRSREAMSESLHLAMMPLYSGERPPIKLCPKLSTLLLQCDPEQYREMEHWELRNDEVIIGGRHGYYWPIYLVCPHVTSLELTGDDGLWLPDDIREAMAPTVVTLGHIRHLFLHNSLCTPKDLCDVLTLFPALETLYLTSRQDTESATADPTEAPGILDESLTIAGRRLRNLDLGWWDCRPCLEEIGEDSTLTCLPKLPRVESLCIQLNLLYRNFEPEHLTPDLVDLLPPSLTRLTLEEWWWVFSRPEEVDPDLPQSMEAPSPLWSLSYPQWGWYRAVIRGLLLDLARRSGALPGLRRVEFQVRLHSIWSQQVGVKLADHMAEVKAEFVEKGIEFVSTEI